MARPRSPNAATAVAVLALAALGAAVVFTPDPAPAVADARQAEVKVTRAASPAAQSAAQLPSTPPKLTPSAASVWQRVMARADNDPHPFVILDKRAATVFVFDGQGRLQGQSPVLLGLAVGDDSVPGIGQRAIADIRPAERTTPAGRFAAEPGRNHQQEDIVWIDYDAAVSMHRLRATAEPAEMRPHRLASASAADNRISYGCVNVPPAFYDAHIRPALGRGGGVVYVLPETRSVERQFPDLFDAARNSPA